MKKKDLGVAGAERRKQLLQSGVNLRERVVEDKKKDPKRSRRAFKQGKVD